MTLKKLLLLLQDIQLMTGISMHGSYISTTGGGELQLDFNTQPSRRMHEYLRRKGFIYWETHYIYRPR